MRSPAVRVVWEAPCSDLPCLCWLAGWLAFVAFSTCTPSFTTHRPHHPLSVQPAPTSYNTPPPILHTNSLLGCVHRWSHRSFLRSSPNPPGPFARRQHAARHCRRTGGHLHAAGGSGGVARYCRAGADWVGGVDGVCKHAGAVGALCADQWVGNRAAGRVRRRRNDGGLCCGFGGLGACVWGGEAFRGG